jgi:N-carbamoylputrescine amidase
MKVKIGLVQMSCEKDKEKNIEKAIKNIKDVAKKGANIICLQELFASLYFCDVEDYDNFSLSESIPGKTTERFSSLAKELNTVIIVPIFERQMAGVYFNSVVVIDADGSLLGKYRKMHIPDDPGYYEKFYFTPGDLGYKVFDTKYGKLGVLICWDQWYPEASRLTALQGADILFYPTAIGWGDYQDEATNKEQYYAWQTIQRSHAIANGVHTVTVNRVGKEGNMKFWGGSFVSNPFGTLLYEATHDNEENQVVEIDTSSTEYYRQHWPFYRDRRLDSYQDITKKYIDKK